MQPVGNCRFEMNRFFLSSCYMKDFFCRKLAQPITEGTWTINPICKGTTIGVNCATKFYSWHDFQGAMRQYGVT